MSEPQIIYVDTGPHVDHEYLGDGLYANHDSHQLWLFANHHETPTDKVALQRDVYEALKRYAKRIGWEP